MSAGSLPFDSGQGCPLQLEAASLAMQNVDFGVAVGNTGAAAALPDRKTSNFGLRHGKLRNLYSPIS